jgi:hypothetical protein
MRQFTRASASPQGKSLRGGTVGEQLIYRLAGVDAETGVDVSEIAGVLIQFAQLVRSASDVLDLGLSVDVRVRPFREGSWITEFILQSGPIRDLLQYFKSSEGQDLRLLLELLGIAGTGVGGLVGVAKAIRFTKGKISRFAGDAESTFTYTNELGENIKLTLSEHTLVQSPLIQNNYYNTFIAPLEQFEGVTGIEVGLPGETPERFTPDDKSAFDEYARAELVDLSTENVTTTRGIWLKPHRGSYAGEETRYSFNMDAGALWPVTIADTVFLGRLKSGEVRLHSEDSLRVDLEISQRLNSRSSVTGSRYKIVKVLQYVPFEPPEQLKFRKV